MRAIDADALQTEYKATHGGKRLLLIDVAPTIEPERKWIPCSEQLPDTNHNVLLCCATKSIYGKSKQYICTGYHVGRYEVESDGNWDEGCDEYREEDDTFYILEGWYERIHNWDDYGAVAIEDSVLAWMPLPEPYGRKENR